MTEDIHDINVYIDPEDKYCFQMRFKCNISTWKKLIAKYDLILDINDIYLDHILVEFEWWQHAKVMTLNEYKTKPKGYQDGPWTQFWYDKANSQVYITRYDL